MLTLTATNLRRTFQDNVAVKDVSLELREGESVGLVGPNGAGKSTTIAMLSTLLKPTAGDVTLNGDSVIARPDPLRKILGVVPQEIALYPELTAEENLGFFGALYGLKGQELRQAVDQALELVELSDRRKESIKKYSGGMKRRINIAAALLHGPRIVIMDEPTVGVDPQSRNHILESVRTLNREHGLTVLYTSHYMEEVEQLCDRIYIMDHGEIIAEGTKDAIKDRLSTETTIVLRVDGNAEQLATALQAVDSVQSVTTDRDGALKIIADSDNRLLASVMREAEAAGAQVTGLNLERPSLEDVFLHLTGRTLRD